MSATTKQILIPICCVCGLVRDSQGEVEDAEDGSWSDLGSYLDRHNLRDADFKLTHTYCPVCSERYLSIGKAYVAGEQGDRRPRFTITGLILQTIRRHPQCNLDALVRACPQYTWNQVFLEVDRLSRSGEIELSSAGPGQYIMSMPEKKRPPLRKMV
jgi:hypothetical protein